MLKPPAKTPSRKVLRNFSQSFTVIPWRALRPFDLAQGMLCGRIFLSDRQRKRKLAAFPRFALDPDPSPMQLNKLLGQR